MAKILIIRFSSIGDIIQCMSVTSGIRQKFPHDELHWVARRDMAPLLRIDPNITRIWELDRKSGLKGLLNLAFELRRQGFTHVYDAHSNIRSSIYKLVICPLSALFGFGSPLLVTRHKHRVKRMMLFSFGINRFPKPFRAFKSFQKPLEKWRIHQFPINSKTWHFDAGLLEKVKMLMDYQPGRQLTALVPSAAWELKRWPVAYWQAVVAQSSDRYFVVLGGPDDHFCADIAGVAPNRVINLAGKTSLLESFAAIYLSDYVISGDTGFLHAADLFGKPGMAIIGPTAFGFPTGPQIKVMEVDLPCRPCTKDGSTRCRIAEKRKCLMDIRPELVVAQMKATMR
ncbi:heptosyltransferase-2 [Breznakibacter xylanolyticus]|uniref:Heptosyltransferase-2 n=1 Tax=Breznakibacter xylanolyticus TaxID=990 RepID=A0A2W7N932_9BACT|nr:glycosyltransferase family 9 protein [Breznakibacter xylanolyticus]PZX16701.1 heptosyltransferase-2 [Breznakibacter xylanolyticus]